MIRVAFDVDGTLWDFDDRPRWDVINQLLYFSGIGCEITVWSGGGADYAERIVRHLNLNPYVTHIKAKEMRSSFDLKNPQIDISFDDEDVKLAKVNIRVPPYAKRPQAAHQDSL